MQVVNAKVANILVAASIKTAAQGLGTDTIPLEGAAISNFAALVVQQVPGNTTIDTGQGTITLIGITAADLSSSDFVFM